MAIRVVIAGATGWVGSVLVRAVLESEDFELVGAIARQKAGQDIGEALGMPAAGVTIVKSLEEVLPAGPEVLIDYTKPDSVKQRTLEALKNGVRVVVGTSGLTGEDYEEIEKVAKDRNLGVVAAGNFTITGALAKHFSQIAAQYVPSWEIIDYGLAGKVDSPSGTTREVAEEMAKFAENQVEIPVEKTFGAKEARGAKIGGAQVHSLRLPGYQHAFETILALPDERLIIRHEAGPAAETHIYGTLLAARKVMEITGVVRGLDRLMFG